jgi:GT2 family glycosyltransferase
MSEGLPRVAVVMVHHGNLEITLRALRALADSRDVALSIGLVLADRAGVPDELSVMGGEFDFRGPFHVFAQGPLGYAAALNLGVRQSFADAEFLFFMNHDVLVEVDTVSTLVGALESRPEAVAVGPVLLFPGEDGLVWNAGSVMHWPSARPGSLHYKGSLADVPTEPYEVDYVCGAALLMRRSDFNECGPWPEEYFLYFEDAELGEHVRRAGKKNMVVPTARSVHHVGSATSAQPARTEYYRVRNRILFSRRWAPAGIGPRLRRAHFVLKKLFKLGSAARGAWDGWLGRSS